MKTLNLPILALVFLAYSCQQLRELDAIEPLDYTAEFALPLVNSRTSSREILNSIDNLKTVIINPDGTLLFRYRGEVIRRTSDEIFANISAAIPPLIPALAPSLPIPFTLPDGVVLDRVEMKTGAFSYYFENPANEPLTVEISIPQLTRNGQPFVLSQTVAAYSGTGARPSGTNQANPANLAGYVFLPVNGLVNINYRATTASGRTVRPELLVYQLNNLTFAYAEGNFGTALYEGGRDTIDIDFFQEYVSGNVLFTEPRVRFYFENSFGVPSRVIVNDFAVINVRGATLKLESSILRTGIDLPYPALNERGKVKRDTFTLNRSNSNLINLLGSGPTKAIYDIDALTNPDDPQAKGFVTDQGYYSVLAEIDLPLVGRVLNFVNESEYGLKFGDFDEVDKAQFKIVVDNEIPLDATVQGYFLDAQGKVLDSLLTPAQLIVQGAPTNAQGFATGVASKTTFADFPPDRFERIRQATILKVRLNLSTEVSNPGKSVWTLADQEIAVRVGVKIGVKTK